jgi:hypothetical protein
MMSGMTGAERAEVMVRMTFGPNHRITFSPDGALLASRSRSRFPEVRRLLPDAPILPARAVHLRQHREDQSRCGRHGSLIRQAALDR